MTHDLRPTSENLHGRFGRDLSPVLTVASGDRIAATTLDAGWHLMDQPDLQAPPVRFERTEVGHALLGPIAVEDAEPGDALEIAFEVVHPGSWGWTVAGGWASEFNERLGVAETKHGTQWRIEGDRATSLEGRTLSLSPFLGWVGLMPEGEGPHSTTPPRRVGGNLDCKELVEGSSLFLPVEVAGGLLSFGDGHAVQGDGEVSGVALECPMARVEMTLVLHKRAAPPLPWAQTPSGLLTMGFGERLDDAMYAALNGMVDLMATRMGVLRNEALMLASLKADLRVTQIVNEVKGVHALLSLSAMAELGIEPAMLG